MAKQQTFQDKLKKMKTDSRVNVRVIKAYRSDKGTVKFVERFVKVDDANQIEKIDISR
ncbi:MAG: hypothetical protein ACKOAX_08990 [Candidatus Kapaibacterium sp.]